MMQNMVKEVQHRYGGKLDDISIALMKGEFTVIEIERTLEYSGIETSLTLLVSDVQVQVKLNGLTGLGGL